jgi:uncharacterized protein (DUF433 family)
MNGMLGGTIYTMRVIAMRYQDYIEIVPGKRGGKPCLVGMRITVADVLGWLASGMDESSIVADYPQLTPEHIRACLAYAAEREHHQLSVA